MKVVALLLGEALWTSYPTSMSYIVHNYL